MTDTAQPVNSSAQPAPETRAFQAEMSQLLNIIIHSLYSEREVFLRELISNAADALSKLKFHMLTQPQVRDPQAELEITLEIDAAAKAVVISDNGIGMTRDELAANLGTIAKSGTLAFLKELTQTNPQGRQELIGQFGVGFYAAFMAAKRVVVDSCPADPGQPAWQWASEGEGTFQLAPSTRTHRGTTVRVELREDAQEFAAGWRLEEIIRKYSNFIPFPIRMEGRRLNTLEALWARPKEDVSAEQHQEFFKYLTHGMEAPWRTLHFSIDAPVQYRALLYLPRHVSSDVLYNPEYTGLQLYANKVFIQSDCRDLLPPYLRFLRGVVDSEDVPLNVSREMAQRGGVLDKIKTSLTGRVLREWKELAQSSPEDYALFWKEYGRVIKEGLPTDFINRERLVELLRFDSSAEGALQPVSLKEYLGRMKDGQTEILYALGSSRNAVLANPGLEFFKSNGLEVLYLTDPVDGFLVNSLGEFEGKRLAAIDQEGLEALKLGQPAPTSSHESGDTQPLVDFLTARLKGRVSRVAASQRLVESPAVLVHPAGESAQMDRMMRMMDKDYQAAPKVLEVNPRHPLLRHMGVMLAHDPADPLLGDLADQLLDNCRMAEGLADKPEQMAARIGALMTRAAELRAASVSSGGSAQPNKEVTS
ncbi:MAG: molecular chaperone HtpG [Deltaproteobacteria bacterium]|nr:molecular chaperone HtpG [Deltaproteobacteria bacterium]